MIVLQTLSYSVPGGTLVVWLTDEPQNIEAKMLNSRMKIVFFLVLLGYLSSGCAQLKEAGRTIGHLGTLRQLSVMGLVMRLKLLVRE